MGPRRARRGDAAVRSGRVAHHTTRSFRVWEGGGEYNVARGLKRCFGLDTALVSAFADNPVGRLLQDLIYQGGVDQSHVRWAPYDGVGRATRNGLNFVERGFGVRARRRLLGSRAHRGVAAEAGRHRLGRHLRAGRRALAAHRRHLLRAVGDDAGRRARGDGSGDGAAMRSSRSTSTTANRCGARYGGHDARDRGEPRPGAAGRRPHRQRGGFLGARIGIHRAGRRRTSSPKLDLDQFKSMIRQVVREFPNLQVVATTLRHAKTATVNDWSAICVGRRRVLPGDAAAEPRDSRSDRRRRLVRVRADLRPHDGARPAVGGRVRRRARRARDDHAR